MLILVLLSLFLFGTPVGQFADQPANSQSESHKNKHQPRLDLPPNAYADPSDEFCCGPQPPPPPPPTRQ